MCLVHFIFLLYCAMSVVFSGSTSITIGFYYYSIFELFDFLALSLGCAFGTTSYVDVAHKICFSRAKTYIALSLYDAQSCHLRQNAISSDRISM